MAEQRVLLEIGAEEIPARFIPGALGELKASAERVFAENRVGFRGVRAYGTPRRLAVMAEGVPPVQEDMVREVFGPARKAAFDSDGKPTRAAEGFARSVGLSPGELTVRKKGKGEYVAATVKEKGVPTGELLPEMLKEIILSLGFPKSMRWGSGNLRFARPIHWILALYGADTVNFELDGILSGNTSRGHRFLSPGEFRIKDIGEYLRLLERNSVVADQERRKASIARQAAEAAASVSGEPVLEEDLLVTVTHLTEYPVVVAGEFPVDYLELPDELLSAVMKGHQKYFAVKDPQGRLKNYFLVTSNTRRENSDVVRAGAERVIRARFEDARFYHLDDRKRPLLSRVEDLKKVTFQERLGSLYDKTLRVERNAGAFAGAVCPAKKDRAARAARLSKADLLTGVVREFPELQGVMGMYYALNDGEDGDVALAVREHYLPAFSGDRLPESDIGAVVALADRMDNLAAFFSVGLTPTGSEDPFALRRQALAVIAVLDEKGYSITIGEMVDAALHNLAHVPGHERAAPGLLRFFEQRLEPLLEARGWPHDLVQSVVGFAASSPLKDITARLEALRRFRREAAFNDFLVAVKRVRNILPEGDLPALMPGLFKEEGERRLKQALDHAAREAAVSLEDSDYAGALSRVSALTGPINAFFDDVLVMDKDQAVRDNRLSLLGEVWDVASRIADFSKLSEAQQDAASG